MPETAEEVARVYNISREDCDAFAVRSHERALAAIEAGRFADEIVPVTVKGRKGAETIVDTDEGPRPGTSLDVLAGLRPVVKGGSVVTAGNASTLNDGASAIIVASEAAVREVRPALRAPASSTAPPPVSPRKSWASARFRPPAKSWTAPASRSATWPPSNSTRPSPRRPWPACAS